MLSYIIFDNPIKSKIMKQIPENIYKQDELWKYGISGDLPIILVKIKDVNDQYVIKEILKAHEFFRSKNIQTEIVILDEEKHSYENYVKEEIEGAILNSQMGYLRNIKGGIFTLSKQEVSKKDIRLLELVSSIYIDSSKGGIENNIKDLEEEYLEKYKEVSKEENSITTSIEESDIDIFQNKEKLKYYNEYGAFSEDGKEYIIKTNKENRLPTVWSNIMANEKFGTIVTENMGGYSWYKNSRLNRASAWENNSSHDIPTEVIYLKDMETRKTWSLGLNPMPDDKNYSVIYGFGYSRFIHKSNGIEQELEVFVPKNDSCKIGILKFKNTMPNKKKIKLYYYMKPVIGEDEIKTNGYIKLNYDKNNNIICMKNLYRSDFEKTKLYISCSEQIKSYTGNKKFFLGNGGISNPDGIKKVTLNNEDSLGEKTCMVYEVEIELESYSEKEISIILGAEDEIIECKNIAYKYRKISNCKQELEKVKNYWNELLRKS